MRKKTILCFFLTSIIAITLAYWFAYNQIEIISPDALSSYPKFYFSITVIKSYCAILAFFVLLRFIFICVWRKSAKNYLNDLVILVFFFIVHFFLTLHYSPAQADLTLNGSGFYATDIPLLASVFKGYVLAKQFSFSDIDYSAWASIMNPPTTLNSPFLQLLAFVFDQPSISYPAFLNLLSMVYFFLIVAGSFGFYLFLKYAAKLHPIFSIFGGCLFFFGSVPFISDVFVFDGGIFLSSYATLPYALLMIAFALEKKSYYLSSFAGMALAAQFFFSSPHPEGVIYQILFYGIFATGLLFFSTQVTFRQKIGIIVTSFLSFFLLSAFVTIPILFDQFSGNMNVVAHTQNVTPISLKFFIGYIISLIILIPISARWSAVYLSTVLVSLCFLLLVFIAADADLISGFSRLTHIHLHFDFFWRMGMFFCLSIFIIAMYSLESIVKLFFSLEKRFWFYFIAICFGVGMIKILHLARLQDNELTVNPQRCPYYITLQSLLVHYPALAGDKANIRLIKNRMLKFENDMHQSKISIESGKQYFNLLQTLNLTTIAAVETEDRIFSIAKKTAIFIDNYYLDKRFFCMNPLYQEWQPNQPSWRLMNFNLAGLYEEIPNKFSRIIGAVEDNSLLGAPPGLWLSNQSMTLDTRFMIGMPLITALYVHPKYDFSQMGAYFPAVPWYFFKPQSFVDPITRKMVDIGGVDIFTMKKTDLGALKISGTQPLHSNINPQFGAKFQSLINRQSYGIAYLANHIYIEDPAVIKIYEDKIKYYFVNRDDSNLFKMTTDVLYQKLMTLKNRHDIFLESQSVQKNYLQDDRPAGSVVIKNIIGERAFFKTYCRREMCTFVFNIAQAPGWHAVVNGVAAKIERANFAFMAINVPHGFADVWFIYEPLSRFLSYFISIFSLIWIVFIHKNNFVFSKK